MVCHLCNFVIYGDIRKLVRLNSDFSFETHPSFPMSEAYQNQLGFTKERKNITMFSYTLSLYFCPVVPGFSVESRFRGVGNPSLLPDTREIKPNRRKTKPGKYLGSKLYFLPKNLLRDILNFCKAYHKIKTILIKSSSTILIILSSL